VEDLNPSNASERGDARCDERQGGDGKFEEHLRCL
jgi:hypothetical protein